MPANPALTNVLPNSTNSYVQMWNLTVQHEVGAGVAVQAGYVGNRGTHLERRYETNAALPPGPGAINARRRYPQFLGISLADSSSFASYHSLQVQAEKRLRAGLQFLTAYTWSKSLDDTSSFTGLGGQESFFPQTRAGYFSRRGVRASIFGSASLRHSCMKFPCASPRPRCNWRWEDGSFPEFSRCRRAFHSRPPSAAICQTRERERRAPISTAPATSTPASARLTAGLTPRHSPLRPPSTSAPPAAISWMDRERVCWTPR